MEAIAKNLSDPSWWFSALFVAIIASVIAGFLKDRVERMFSRVSDSFRRRRANELEVRNKTLEALVENPTYLSFALHRVTLRLVLWVMATLLFLSTPILLYVTPPSDETLIWLGQKEFARKALMPLMGVVSAVIGFRAATSISIVFEALKRFRAKYGLPKLP
jgi:hypothetical protein